MGPALPSAPSVNPFGATASQGGPQLPHCFATLEQQLPAVIRAKLKTVDVSTAHVVVSTPRGRKSDPTPLLWFIEDFGEEAAQLVGSYGLLRVAVLEPNKAPWFFGIKVEAPEGEEHAGGHDGGLRDFMAQMLEAQRQFMENVKLELLLASGRSPHAQPQEDSFDRELRRFTLMAEAMRAANPGTDAGAIIRTTFESMGHALDGVGKLRDQAAQLGQGGAEPDPIDQFNKLTENPLVQMGAQKLFSGALKSRTPETAAGTASPPTTNPFKKGVA